MATHARKFRLDKPPVPGLRSGDRSGGEAGTSWTLPDDMQSRLEALVAAGEATRHVCDDGRVLYEIRSFPTPTIGRSSTGGRSSPLEGEGKGGGPLLVEIIRSF